MTQIKLSYATGALQPTFIQQVKKQKLKFKADHLRTLQKQRESVFMLEFNDLITEKVATAALKKIVSQVVIHVAATNGLERVKQPKK